MGNWYEVIKTIKGRPYRYRQRTWREGKHVRTQSHSLGPASPADVERIRAEAKQRRVGPSIASVRRMFRLLTDSANAAAVENPEFWVSTPVNTTARQPPLIRNLIRAHSMGVIHSPDVAAYHWGADVLLMPPPSHFPSGDGYTLTAMHEMAHWSGAAWRLGRRFGRMRGTYEERQDYAREEVVAETTAWVALAELGMRPGPEEIAPHAYYLQFWLARTADPAATLAYAEGEVQRATRFLLSVNTTL